jgi:hypothetical protein
MVAATNCNSGSSKLLAVMRAPKMKHADMIASPAALQEVVRGISAPE